MRTINEEKIKQLSEFIKQFTRTNNGTPPSLSEIVQCTGISKATAYRYILELERRGVLSYGGKKTLETELQRKMNCKFKKIPLVGQIVCGTPDEQEEYVSEYLAIPSEWTDGECFLLRAYGDSMVDIGIMKDDLILVKKTETAKNGEVVVALTENGSTLKRLFWENGKPRLRAENKNYSAKDIDIYPRSLTVQGVALKVIKNIR